MALSRGEADRLSAGQQRLRITHAEPPICVGDGLSAVINQGVQSG
jgi:hypothetical protein